MFTHQLCSIISYGIQIKYDKAASSFISIPCVKICELRQDSSVATTTCNFSHLANLLIGTCQLLVKYTSKKGAGLDTLITPSLSVKWHRAHLVVQPICFFQNEQSVSNPRSLYNIVETRTTYITPIMPGKKAKT